MASLLLLPQQGKSEIAAGYLCIYLGRTDIEIARYATDHTRRFSLSFLHSVSLTPVVDHYQIRANTIHQTAEVFEAHGAGLPSFAGDVGEIGWKVENGKFILEMDRQFQRIQLRIQREYHNALQTADQKVILADFGTDSIGLEVCEQRGK